MYLLQVQNLYISPNIIKILATEKLSEVKKAKYIIICIGTPIDDRLNPQLKNFVNFFYSLKKYLKKNHIIIIRSSIYPGICDQVFKIIKKKCVIFSVNIVRQIFEKMIFSL